MTDTLVLRRSRGKTALATLGSAIFVALGLLMIRGGMDDSARYSPEMIRLIGSVCILGFGAACVFGLWSLYRPAEVRLTPEGFQVKDIRKGRLIAWREVRRFYVTQIRSAKIVSYELDRELTDFQRTMGIARTGPWGDGSIPNHLELHPDKVLDLLEDWRRRHAG